MLSIDGKCCQLAGCLEGWLLESGNRKKSRFVDVLCVCVAANRRRQCDSGVWRHFMPGQRQSAMAIAGRHLFVDYVACLLISVFYLFLVMSYVLFLCYFCRL